MVDRKVDWVLLEQHLELPTGGLLAFDPTNAGRTGRTYQLTAGRYRCWAGYQSFIGQRLGRLAIGLGEGCPCNDLHGQLPHSCPLPSNMLCLVDKQFFTELAPQALDLAKAWSSTNEQLAVVAGGRLLVAGERLAGGLFELWRGKPEEGLMAVFLDY